MDGLAKELGIDLTPLEEFERFRAATTRRRCRCSTRGRTCGPRTWTCSASDVGSEFEPGGKIEFRQGKEVLFSRDFAPEDFTTLEEIPAAGALRRSRARAVTWGYFPAKGREVTAQFTIVKEDPRLRERIGKMEERVGDGDRYLVTAMRAQLYLNARLYYAA